MFMYLDIGQSRTSEDDEQSLSDWFQQDASSASSLPERFISKFASPTQSNSSAFEFEYVRMRQSPPQKSSAPAHSMVLKPISQAKSTPATSAPPLQRRLGPAGSKSASSTKPGRLIAPRETQAVKPSTSKQHSIFDFDFPAGAP